MKCSRNCQFLTHILKQLHNLKWEFCVLLGFHHQMSILKCTNRNNRFGLLRAMLRVSTWGQISKENQFFVENCWKETMAADWMANETLEWPFIFLLFVVVQLLFSLHKSWFFDDHWTTFIDRLTIAHKIWFKKTKIIQINERKFSI